MYCIWAGDKPKFWGWQFWYFFSFKNIFFEKKKLDGWKLVFAFRTPTFLEISNSYQFFCDLKQIKLSFLPTLAKDLGTWMTGNAKTCFRKDKGLFSEKGKIENISRFWLDRKSTNFIFNSTTKENVNVILNPSVTLTPDTDEVFD